MKVLRLNLKAKWYDMIESGVKKEEYRETKPYWNKRLTVLNAERDAFDFKQYDVVTFVYGYTRRTMSFEIESIRLGFGKPEWGAPERTIVYVIRLGKKLN